MDCPNRLQAVKDVLKQLTDDDFVREGKVGVSTYYWSFPAEAATKKRGELHRAARDVALLRQQVICFYPPPAKVPRAKWMRAQWNSAVQEAEAAKQQHNATVQQLSPEEEVGIASNLIRAAALALFTSPRECLQCTLAKHADSCGRNIGLLNKYSLDI
eukprot:6209949-Pleurochrysis_carterae.AAC.1